jgi:hypothetical protein
LTYIYCGNKVIEQIPEKMVLFRISRDITLVLTLMTGVRVLNASYNNISVISWRSVLSVEETGVPEENH